MNRLLSHLKKAYNKLLRRKNDRDRKEATRLWGQSFNGCAILKAHQP